MKNVESKDSLLLMAKNWIIEWSEIDTMNRVTYEGTIKSFLSSSEDMYRVPYSRDVLRYPRNSVIVGSTNREDFLTDATGNRRFWVISIPENHTIPIEALKSFREDLLGWAVAMYRHGESWQLPQEFKVLQSEANKQWMHQDSWEAVLEPYLETHIEVTVLELLRYLDERECFDCKRIAKRDEMRVGNILTAKKWKRKRVRRGDNRVYAYFSPNLS